jgi:hypothetical protein
MMVLMMTVHEHLLSRGCEPSKYHMFVSEEDRTATFLLWNVSGQLVGYQQYRPDAPKTGKGNRQDLRYWTFIGPEGNFKKTAVFGLETLSWSDKHFFICEGIFDAIKVHNAGFPCLALLCNDPAPLWNFLIATGKKIIAIVDNDNAGQKMKKFASDVLQVPPIYKDIGDMKQEDANILLRNFDVK